MNCTDERCNSCAHSYMDREGLRLRQKCRSSEYNSPDYTSGMFMEDRKRGLCRFWTPEIQGG